MAARRPGFLAMVLPDHPTGAAVMALLIPLPFALAVTVWGTEVLRQYGLALFVGVPYGLGMSSVLIYGYRRPRSLRGCLWVAMGSVLLLGLGLLVLAFEGFVCLVMASPLALVLAALGGGAGYALQDRTLRATRTLVLLAVLGSLPASMGAERAISPEAPRFKVETSLEVEAPPEVVWRHVLSFPDLPPPDEWVFRAGVAYPVRARIVGTGEGALRFCVFSTGAFVEPITAWEEPRLLAFSVRSNPPPLQEWSPYAEIHPPHLESFLVSEAGEFRLTALPGGRTRLVGTTWYRHGLWPARYWRWWSDAIIHRIHRRVLKHVQQLSETASS